MKQKVLPISLVSSDLNGTLVHQHTMSDMIRQYIGEEKFREADAVFKKQTSGMASMEEAFSNAGPLTKGLTLRQAIDYTKTRMEYVTGFFDFVNALGMRSIPFVINSTGYSVTFYSIREQIGFYRINGFIGNYLKFGWDGDVQATLNEVELEKIVRDYFNNSEATRSGIYDSLQATGIIELGIVDETAKALLVVEYAQKYFPEISSAQIAHIGDTMGDSGGILGIAEKGGIGIAFNYNKPLQDFLEEKVLANPDLRERIYYIDAKGPSSDLRHLLPLLSP